jgi:hypothetical protein
VRRKLRALELKAGAPRAKPDPNPDPIRNAATDAAEKRLAIQAEASYRRLVADWQASGPAATHSRSRRRSTRSASGALPVGGPDPWIGA